MNIQEHKTSPRLWRTLIVVGLIVASVLALWQVSVAAPQANAPYNHGRFGFGVTRTGGEPTLYDVASLNAGWYWDWSAKGETAIPSTEYMQTVRLQPVKSDGVQIGYTASPTGTTLRNRVKAQPGGTWLIGNEPDCTSMDNMLSEWYARAYHDMYYLIKSIDPTAQIAAGSIVQPTLQRFMYLDRVLATYQQEYGEPLPADLWATHSYILCEKCYPFKQPGEPFAWGACWVPDWPSYNASYDIATFYSVYDHWDIEIFKERLVTMRQWMYDNGYRNHPLLISEYGILFYDGLVSGMTTQDNIDFMYAGFDWMLEARDPILGFVADDDRLIQRWAWFSLDHDDWYMGGPLFNPYSHQRTALGTAFATYTREYITPTIQVRLLGHAFDFFTDAVENTIRITSSFTIANQGDLSTPVTITVYEKQTATMPISATILDELHCCGDYEQATVAWSKTSGNSEEFCVHATTSQTSDQLLCETLSTDIQLDHVWAEATVTQTQTPTTATLYAEVANYGNIGTLQPITLTFYSTKTQRTSPLSEQATSDLIGQAIVRPLLCCGDHDVGSIVWSDFNRGDEISVGMSTSYMTATPVSVTLNSDLTVTRVWAPPAHTIIGVPATGTLYALVTNEGALETGSPVTVSFYVSGTSQLPIGEVTLPALECCGDQAEAVLRWPNLPDVDIVEFCAIASTPYDTSEPTCNYLLINPFQLYLPTVSKN